MRLWILPILVLAVAGCTRPSAGISFHQLVWAASDGLREYELWVQKENEGFPNQLCLAGIHFSASLAETTGQSGSIGLPLAAPAFGLTGMLGYKFISSQSETGTISTSLEAVYREEPAKSETPRQQEERENDLKAFIDGIPTRYSSQRDDLLTGKIKEPRELDEYATRNRPAFSQRNDLAAELWRIRQTIHGAVLNSPSRDIVFKPGPMTLRVKYVATTSAKGGVSINLAGQPLGDFGASGGATEANEMVLFYVNNQSDDKFTCNKKSLPQGGLQKLIRDAGIKTVPAAAPAPPS